ncbi:MAG: T9SS type A sorting domain-containing protein [Sphingobacteriales bacterium JAD_PAG50586_3]|nr:MAG: T9SS type A sorting domain-containing protein [Sphingobacteriales bacterium JAD_PAG50586_3]
MKKKLILAAFTLLSIVSNAQQLNMDFESWDETNPETPLPDNWVVANGMGQFGIFRDSVPQQGNYAMTLSRWYYYTFDDAVQQSAVNFKPATLSGYYKYTDNLIEQGGEPYSDTAHVYVFATKWNTQTQQRDTLGSGHLKMFGTDFWTEFNCPVYYTSSDMPDSVIIRLAPTERDNGNMGLCSMKTSGWCSYFTVDNLSLTENTTGISNAPADQFMLYPNPAADKVFIATTGNKTLRYSLTNAVGKTIVQQTPYTTGDAIDIEGLPAGMYFLTINNNGMLSTLKIVKQ